MLRSTTMTIVLLSSLAVLLPACENGTGVTTESQTDDQQVAAEQDVVNAVGEAFSDQAKVLTIADISTRAEELEGQLVRIQGTCVHRCGSGCSLTLAQDDARFKVRTDMDAFMFPEEWADKEVVVEGTVHEDAGCSKIHAERAEKAAAGDAGADAPAEGDAHPDEHAEGHAEHAEGHDEHHDEHAEGHHEGAREHGHGQATYVLKATGARLAG